MKSSALFSLACLLLIAGSSADIGPTSNYLDLAYDSALAMRERYNQQMEYFHTQLTDIVDEMGHYYLEHMEEALEQAATQDQGEALRLCARQASLHAQDSILGVRNAVFATEKASTVLHLSIYEQLMATNIMESTLDAIYYLHSSRMEDAYTRLTDELAYEMINKATYLYFDFYAITEELDDCVAVAMN